MWLFTKIGFFSAVQKSGTNCITIRARVRNDLDRLRHEYLPDLSPTVGNAGTDYPWRATAPHAKFAAALSKMVLDIDYGNFKDEIAKRQGKARASRYGKVWSALYDMPEEEVQENTATVPWNDKVLNSKKVAFGGVVFDSAGRVILREPRNHYDGYVWTFPKGRPEAGETPEETALREVKEETGVEATIVEALPKEYLGGTTVNFYFIMHAADGSGFIAPDDPETASIQWITVEEASTYIQKTTNLIGQQRDLSVLSDAISLFKSL